MAPSTPHRANKWLSAMVATAQSHAMSVEVATYLLSGKSRYCERNNTATVVQISRSKDPRHILIPTDGSELSKLAIEEGIALAKALAARVTVLTVTIPFTLSLPIPV